MRSAGGGLGKKAFRSIATFCVFVAAWPSRVGTNVDVGILVTYFLTCHIVLPLALFTYSFHLLALACAISCTYSSALALHMALSTSCFVRLYIFLSRFASFRKLDNSSVHHRLLCGLGRLRGVVSYTAFVMALTSCSAYLSMSASVVASPLIQAGFGR